MEYLDQKGYVKFKPKINGMSGSNTPLPKCIMLQIVYCSCVMFIKLICEKMADRLSKSLLRTVPTK